MTPRFELALAALLDLQDEVRDQWTQSYFQSRFYSAVEHGQNEALIKAAISLLQSLHPVRPLPVEDGERLAS